MFKGKLSIDGKEIEVSNVEAIDKGVDTYFKGTAAEDVPQAKGGTLNLTNAENASLIIKNCVIEHGGKNFEGFGQE
ncbi:hypothetical protein AAIR98_001509 [Elusimicrobium simillimum]|uniref:hypothetical protein n=1 Tax=Elusimicrobium simillimum TaxID=3143438 RepID=UPI003C6F0B8A